MVEACKLTRVDGSSNSWDPKADKADSHGGFSLPRLRRKPGHGVIAVIIIICRCISRATSISQAVPKERRNRAPSFRNCFELDRSKKEVMIQQRPAKLEEKRKKRKEIRKEKRKG